MTTEPMIPAAREDDPEEVSDKLSIAAAMWARGEKVDALSWLRRAAESASDAEADMRALELAKAASVLADSVTATAVAASPSSPSTAKVEVAKPTPVRSTPAARPPTAPPSRPAARPGGKLPPLPPLRPLGTSPPPAPRSRPPEARGVASQPKTVAAAPAATPSPVAPAAPTAPTAPATHEADDEETSQIAVSAHLLAQSSEALPPLSSETTPVAPAADPDDSDLRATMRREGDAEPSAAPASEKIPKAPVADEPTLDRASPVPVAMPLAVGIRARLVASDEGVRVVPDDGAGDGIEVIIVPVRRDDDLRTILHRIKR